MIKNAASIRAEINIVDVIGKELTLRKRGVNYVALCPFHNENSESFTVFPNTNTYKCFGCGEGGDAIHFLMEHLGLTFPEALEKAASQSSISVEYESSENRAQIMERAKEEKAKKEVLGECLFTVHRFYQDHFPLPALYCDLKTKGIYIDADGRELKAETAETFGMCYTPDENAVVKTGFWEMPLLEEVGVVRKGQYGHYDFFRNRMLFRITNNTGKIVGMGGRRRRANDGTDTIKFLNSPESILYNKSDVLFGLHENRRGIKEAGFAILVEGYMDVVTPYDFGVKNCVASCGTALTEQQAKLLKRYTDEVLILRDGDPAGMEAAKRDVETLVRVGINSKVCTLKPNDELIKNFLDQKDAIEAQKKELTGKDDDKSKAVQKARKLLAQMEENLQRMKTYMDALKDPDTFLRTLGGAEFIDFLESNAKDGIIWRVMEEYDATDVFSKDTATQVAATLLGLIESETLREHYVRELCKPSNLGSVKTILANAVKTASDKKLSKEPNLTPKQKQDVLNYGIYEHQHRYFYTLDTHGTGWAVSNFTIKPIIFIEGAKESIRLVEITNERKQQRILDINSRNFVELGPFKQTIEARGNFRFDGKPEHFQKVKAKVYDEMKTAFPIYTLGLHKEGFFAFANGIINEGKFSPVDEYGIVAHGDNRFYLPAFSKIRDHIKSDDVDNDYQDEQYYVYTTGDPGITFADWCQLMHQVHGDNAVIGILYMCSVFIREKIFERLDNMFPLLNFFGLPGSGKNQLAASIAAIFGKYRPPVHIVNATDAAFFRRIAQMRNGLAWYDEYSNNCDHKRVEALKQFADGTGRSRATVDNPNRTISSQVNSGCIISGQQQPTADIALFTRCISLSFGSTEFDQTAKDRHARLKKLEQDGRLTAFTAMLHNLRPHMMEKFAIQFEETYSHFVRLLEGNQVMDRIVRSYTAMLTTYELLQEKVGFSFTKEQVEAILIKSILTQKESVYQENEVSIWWRMVERFMANGDIEHGIDVIVEECTEETFDLDWKGSKETKQYKAGKRLLYLYLARTHPLYLENHQRQRNVKGLDVEALKYYLKASPGWEGLKRAKKFQGVAKTCLVFDVAKIPFEMEDTIAALSRRNRRVEDEAGSGAPTATAVPIPNKPAVIESPINDDLPF